ncbi:hypothetical protein TNCV_1070851 [Trichonephila clavipes]|nr:hypothetical protein TNCV_1070851 [Trichonephila clavipes]
MKVDSDDVQELLDSLNQELRIDEFLEMHEKEQETIEKLESLDPFQSEKRRAFGNLTEGLSLIEKGLQISENIDSDAKSVFLQQNKEEKDC